MNFQVFHVNPGKKQKKKDVNNDLSHFMLVFPNGNSITYIFFHFFSNSTKPDTKTNTSLFGNLDLYLI